jgi:phosphatidylserine/phosphatidylglycerophosphate/cardiolipin synthase-like enzyme
MVVSDDKCMLTSANFNKYGLKLNREVGVVIYSKEASDFLADQFMEDWRAEGFGAIYAIPAIILLAFAIFIAYKGLKD